MRELHLLLQAPIVKQQPLDVGPFLLHQLEALRLRQVHLAIVVVRILHFGQRVQRTLERLLVKQERIRIPIGLKILAEKTSTMKPCVSLTRQFAHSP